MWITQPQSTSEKVLFRPSAPPAGRPKPRIWLRKKKTRRRRGRPLFSSALLKSGAKKECSSSIRTSSRSTHCPGRHTEKVEKLQRLWRRTRLNNTSHPQPLPLFHSQLFTFFKSKVNRGFYLSRLLWTFLSCSSICWYCFYFLSLSIKLSSLPDTEKKNHIYYKWPQNLGCFRKLFKFDWSSNKCLIKSYRNSNQVILQVENQPNGVIPNQQLCSFLKPSSHGLE